MDKLQTVLKQIAAFWASLSTPKRVALAGLSSLVLVTVLLISIYGNREHYAYLYTGLDQQDAGQIVEKLKSMQVPYQLGSDSTSIQVPEERIPALRLELASSGLPRGGGGVGFEIFDKSQIGATEFEQQVNLKRALEGELTRSILSIDGVKAARVHLVMPEKKLFARSDEQASASVVLKLTNVGTFGKRETAGIVHLVAAAVPGLHRDRISVVSTDGVTLHRPLTGENDGDGGAGDVTEEQSRSLASQMEADVRSQLERIVGPGNADVKINVALGISRKEKVEEHYEPSKTALRSEQKLEELSGTGSPGVAGVPGALTNLPDAQQAGAEATESTTGPEGGLIRRSHTRNWEVDKVSMKTSTPPGEVERLSVAVLVNEKRSMVGGKMASAPRTPQELSQLEELVKRAVGFVPDRGDSVQVSSFPFATLDVGDLGTDTSPKGWRKWLPFAIGGFLLLVMIAVVVLVWRKKQLKARKTAALTQLTASSATQSLPGEVVVDENGQPVLSGGVSMPALPESQQLDGPALRTRALELASSDPATAAIILKKWLSAAAPTPAPSPARG